MKLDNLNADQFMQSLADVTEAVGVLISSESGKAIIDDLNGFRGSINKDEDADGKVVEWLTKTITARLPQFVRENGDNVYKLLAACDGITLEEYKADFTPAKLFADVKGLMQWIGQNREQAAAFFE